MLLCVGSDLGWSAPHHIDEAIEEMCRVMWSRGCLGMILDGKDRPVLVSDPFECPVIEVHPRDHKAAFLEAVGIDGKAVVLRGNLDCPGG